MFFLHFDYWQVVEVDDGRKTNVWSTHKFSKEMHTAVLVTFSPPSSVQSKMVKNALIIWEFIDALNVGFSPIITSSKYWLTLAEVHGLVSHFMEYFEREPFDAYHHFMFINPNFETSYFPTFYFFNSEKLQMNGYCKIKILLLVINIVFTLSFVVPGMK